MIADHRLNRMKLSCLTTLLLLIFPAFAAAGGLQEINGVFDADSDLITNPWWPLDDFETLVYFEEGDDECVVDILEILDTAKTVDGVEVQEVLDQEFLDEDCDGNGEELLESTLDWYAQDTSGNIWYFGEATVSYDWDECDNPDGAGGCLDGSWEAGQDVFGVGSLAEAGILLLAVPEHGAFYFQEYYEDVAVDMAKVLNFKTVDTFLFGEQENCLVTKEWSPLERGAVEQKYYCEGLGLVLIAELSGGKTLWVHLVDFAPAA